MATSTPDSSHPLDRRLGAGRYNEAQWEAMAGDGRIAPERPALQQGAAVNINLDRPTERLLREEPDVVHRIMAPPPVASQAKGRPLGPDSGMIDQTWRYVARAQWPLGSYEKGGGPTAIARMASIPMRIQAVPHPFVALL